MSRRAELSESCHVVNLAAALTPGLMADGETKYIVLDGPNTKPSIEIPPLGVAFIEVSPHGAAKIVINLPDED
jgi:hypothetical protein